MMKKTLLALLTVSLITLSGCSEDGLLFSTDFTGTEGIVTNEKSFGPTTQLDNLRVIVDDIFVKQGALQLNVYDYGNPRIEIKTNQNIYETIQFENHLDQIKISGEGHKKYVTDLFEISLYGVNVKYLDIDGAAVLTNSLYGFKEDFELKVNGVLVADLNLEYVKNVDIDIAGTAQLVLSNVNLEELKVETSGISTISAKGKIGYYEDKISGTHDLEFFDVAIDRAYINLSGVGVYEMKVNEILDIKSSGTIQVDYEGAPVLSTVIAGINHIAKVEK